MSTEENLTILTSLSAQVQYLRWHYIKECPAYYHFKKIQIYEITKVSFVFWQGLEHNKKDLHSAAERLKKTILKVQCYNLQFFITEIKYKYKKFKTCLRSALKGTMLVSYIQQQDGKEALIHSQSVVVITLAPPTGFERKTQFVMVTGLSGVQFGL